MFKALAKVVLGSAESHSLIRAEIQREYEANLPEYISLVQKENPSWSTHTCRHHLRSQYNPGRWGDAYSLSAFSNAFKRYWHISVWKFDPHPFAANYLHSRITANPQWPSHNNTLHCISNPIIHPDKPTIHLWLINDNHFDLLHPILPSDVLSGYQILDKLKRLSGSTPPSHLPLSPPPTQTTLNEDISATFENSHIQTSPNSMSCQFAHALISTIKPPATATLVVIGCGTGHDMITMGAIGKFSTIIGIDSDPTKIEKSKTILNLTKHKVTAIETNIALQSHDITKSFTIPTLISLLPPHDSPTVIVSLIHNRSFPLIDVIHNLQNFPRLISISTPFRPHNPPTNLIQFSFTRGLSTSGKLIQMHTTTLDPPRTGIGELLTRTERPSDPRGTGALAKKKKETKRKKKYMHTY